MENSVRALAPQAQNLPRNQTGESCLKRLVSALEFAGWTMTPTLKAQFSKANIDEAIEEAEYQLAPAGIEDLVIAIDRLMTFARTFAIQTDRAGLTEIWRDGSKGMPRRALREGVTEVLSKSTDTYRVPMPGAVWDIMRDQVAKWESEVAALREVRRRMSIADVPQLAAPERIPVSPEYARQTQEITEKTLAMLKSKSKGVRIF